MSEGSYAYFLRVVGDLTPVSKVGIISLLLSRKDIDGYPPNTYTRNYSLECLSFIDDGSSSTKDIDTFARPKLYTIIIILSQKWWIFLD